MKNLSGNFFYKNTINELENQPEFNENLKFLERVKTENTKIVQNSKKIFTEDSPKTEVTKDQVFQHGFEKKTSALPLRKELKVLLNQLLQKKEGVEPLHEIEKKLKEQLQIAIREGALNSPTETSLNVYGNKHKNLIILSKLIEAMGFEDVHVPVPKGLPSDKLSSFLWQTKPKIFAKWNTLGTLYEAHLEKKESKLFLESPEVSQLLIEIHEDITVAFNQIAENPIDIESLGFCDDFKEWLQQLQSRNSYLMVRSTGAEDTSEVVNAGGNKSLAYVYANTTSALHAIGEVVCSYFSKESLQNRINAGQNPFLEDLQMAVTVQELIGEELGGSKNPQSIPVSAVLFTNEPIWIGNEKFRVFRLSGTYGHGEAVVGNMGIATDSVLIVTSVSHPTEMYVLYDRQSKLKRLAPKKLPGSDSISLEKIQNAPEEISKPVFYEKMIARLYQLGILVEHYFDGKPIDMELVIKNGMIFPVQAREVKRPQALPSHLDTQKIENENCQAIEDSIYGEVIVSGKASLISICDAQEILITDTLEQAEKMFNKEYHKAVVVSQSEPQNSHPVVNFSSMGIPCLWMEEISSLKNTIAGLDGLHQLAICLQSGTFYLWNRAKGDLSRFISEGYITHPAKIAISLSFSKPIPRYGKKEDSVPKEVKELLFKIRTAKTSQIALEALYTLRKSPWIHQRMTVYLNDLQELTQNSFNLPIIHSITEGLQELSDKVQRAFEQVEVSLKHPEKIGSLQKLFYIKVLESLLLEPHHPNGALNQLSLLNVEPCIEAAKALANYQKRLSFSSHFADLLLLGTQTPNQEFFGLWQDFLLDLEQMSENDLLDPALISRFKSRLGQMEQAGILPTFLTLFFSALKGSSLDKVHGILDSLNPDEELFLEEAIQRISSIDELTKEIQGFSDPLQFDLLWQSLQDEVVQWFPSKEVEKGNSYQSVLQSDSWSECSPLLQMVLLGGMGQLVDLFDSSIKSMKASSQYSEDKKVAFFHQMLKEYNQLLIKWGYELCPGNISTTKNHIELLLREISSKVNARPSKGVYELFSTPTFAVENSIIGIAEIQNGKYYPESPKSLEDAFTAIHQNLIAIIAGLMRNITQSINQSLFPSLMLKAIKAIDIVERDPVNEWFPKRFRFQKNAIMIKERKISFSYKVPLREHCAHLTLTYDVSDNSVAFQGRFLQVGDKFGAKIAYTASLLNKLNILTLQAPPIVKPGSVEVIWKLKDEKDIARAFQEYTHFCGLTFNRDGNLSTTCLSEIYTSEGFNGCIHILKDSLIPNDQAKGLARFLQEKVNKREVSGSWHDLLIILLKNEFDPQIQKMLSELLTGKELIGEISGLNTEESDIKQLFIQSWIKNDKPLEALLTCSFSSDATKFSSSPEFNSIISNADNVIELEKWFAYTQTLNFENLFVALAEILKSGINPEILIKAILNCSLKGGLNESWNKHLAVSTLLNQAPAATANLIEKKASQLIQHASTFYEGMRFYLMLTRKGTFLDKITNISIKMVKDHNPDKEFFSCCIQLVSILAEKGVYRREMIEGILARSKNCELKDLPDGYLSLINAYLSHNQEVALIQNFTKNLLHATKKIEIIDQNKARKEHLTQDEIFQEELSKLLVVDDGNNLGEELLKLLKKYNYSI